MRHAQSVPVETISVASAFSNHQRRWKIFAAIIDALHHSRRLQAENFIRAHRHLLAGSSNGSEQSTTGGDDNVNR
jgi:hypothetical protein